MVRKEEEGSGRRRRGQEGGGGVRKEEEGSGMRRRGQEWDRRQEGGGGDKEEYEGTERRGRGRKTGSGKGSRGERNIHMTVHSNQPPNQASILAGKHYATYMYMYMHTYSTLYNYTTPVFVEMEQKWKHWSFLSSSVVW